MNNKGNRGWGRWFAVGPSLLKGNWRTLAAVAAVGAGAIAAGRWSWEKWGRPATQGTEYRITADRIEVPPQPVWIQADVKADVLRDSRLGELDLLDPQLAEKVYRAFALHNWVGRVRDVKKIYPGRIVVDLEYRKPIAMVEVDVSHGPGLLFIDDKAVLLPSDDFALRHTQQFVRIYVPKTSPAGPYGTPWGDDRVTGAAEIAVALSELRETIGLKRISAEEVPGGRVMYDLELSSGKKIRWGAVPGKEEESEPVSMVKITRLREAAKNEKLDEVLLDRRS